MKVYFEDLSKDYTYVIIMNIHFSAIATAAQHRARRRTSITSDVWGETKRRCTRHPQFFRPSPCRWLRRICISLAGFASVNGMQKRPGLEGALDSSNSNVSLRILESLCIFKNKPKLNQTDSAYCPSKLLHNHTYFLWCLFN